MMQAVTEDIKSTLRAEIAKRGQNLSEIAREIGTNRNQISRMLSAKRHDSIGQITEVWSKLLDHLGYELTITKKPN